MAKVCFTQSTPQCPVLPLALRVRELWDAHAMAQAREETCGDSIVSDLVDAMRVRAQDIAGASRARSLAGVLFQVALAADAATRMRDQSEADDQRAEKTYHELAGLLNSIGASLRDEPGEKYDTIRPLIEN